MLDTCALLWWQADDPRLSAAARRLIAAAPEAFVSAASAWEIAIKSNLGKLRIPEPVSTALPSYGFIELPITVAHAEQAGALPLHHKDPFDRMLIAQARHEELVLVTGDRSFGAYDVEIFWI